MTLAEYQALIAELPEETRKVLSDEFTKAEQEKTDRDAELESYKSELNTIKETVDKTQQELKDTKALNFTLARTMSKPEVSFEDALLGIATEANLIRRDVK